MMKNVIHLFVLMVFSVLNINCATLMSSGDTQDLSVSSNPPGAIVTIEGEKKLTPTVFFLNRKRDSYSVTIEKPGFKAVTVKLEKVINGWAWGNFVTGGLGLFVDFSTGFIREFIPKEIHVDFLREKVG